MNANCEIYIYKHIYIDLNDCYSNCLSYILMYACVCVFALQVNLLHKSKLI